MMTERKLTVPLNCVHVLKEKKLLPSAITLTCVYYSVYHAALLINLLRHILMKLFLPPGYTGPTQRP